MPNMIIDTINEKEINDYQDAGVTILRGIFRDWIPSLSKGAYYNTKNPSTKALIHNKSSHKGRFLEDFCSWERIPEYKDFIFRSTMGIIAGKLMKSKSAQFFHDHYLDKEANSGITTPWHQDMPYYFVEGEQTVSFWIPLDSRDKDVSLQCVSGSHKLPKEIRPTSWSTMESFYEDDSNFMDMPDIDNGDYSIKVWAMEPGDVVAFNFKTIHGAKANIRKTSNRTISFRLVGDDVRFRQRPGRTSPDFPGINQKNGERLREDWFPVVWKAY